MRGEFSVFRQRLLQWFHQHKRALPWRTHPSLYTTVVSEFMLQQTQVDTVLPYYSNWLARFPDFASLARASEPEVVKQWEGLGYYARARNLHKLAKSICVDGVPDCFDAWLQRPGIGPYTAAAISSIAQNVPEPVVDGNVIRVLCRINNDQQPIRSSTEARNRLLPLARNLIDPDAPGDYNEAIMELGATLCRKTRPDCLLCPVRSHCCANAAGNESSVPLILRRSTNRVCISRLLLIDDERILLHVHPDDAPRLAGLAELPQIDAPKGIDPVLRRTRGISTDRIHESIFVLHREHPLAIKCSQDGNTKWFPLSGLAAVSLSGPHRRWIGEWLLQESGTDSRQAQD